MKAIVLTSGKHPVAKLHGIFYSRPRAEAATKFLKRAELFEVECDYDGRVMVADLVDIFGKLGYRIQTNEEQGVGL